MGHTGNMISNDDLRQMCVPLEDGVYIGDGDGLHSNPENAMHQRHIHAKSHIWQSPLAKWWQLSAGAVPTENVSYDFTVKFSDKIGQTWVGVMSADDWYNGI